MQDPAARAIWLKRDRIAIPTDLCGPGLHFFGNSNITLIACEFNEEDIRTDPRVREGYAAYRPVDRNTGAHLSRPTLQEVLRHSIIIGADLGQTGVQIGGVLDDLYGPAASREELGPTWAGSVPTLRLWAPTATRVNLLVWEPGSDSPERVQADFAESSGTWTVVGKPNWEDAEYLWELDVYTPQLGRVAEVQVTDPYSTGLTVDSKKSVLVNLSASRWKPEDWGKNLPDKLRTQAAQTLYELHVRDFSVYDNSVPQDLRGKYKAFTLDGTVGMQHLRELADAGITSVHLLPTFDIASSSIPEDRSLQEVPHLGGVELHPDNERLLRTRPDFTPASTVQQEAVGRVRSRDAFNWGYDPLHWGVPEGSYATTGNQVGGQRTYEYREMVTHLHQLGLRVVQDVVYNHTMAGGSNSDSVLDRIVPGYYHRLSPGGDIETSTCCANIATERVMAEKLMVDTLVRWVKEYHIDGFRFDLMGHHSLGNMQAVRDALDSLTESTAGVDGSRVYLYGEGWNFGEVAGDALFPQAALGNLAGTGIGAFNDRVRDAVRGGSPFDHDHRVHQGFGSGQFTDRNGHAQWHFTPHQERDSLEKNTQLVMLSLTGALLDYPIPASHGPVLGRNLHYAGQSAAFAKEPQECINYVEAHDNETLYDSNVFKLPEQANMETRVRMHLLANAVVALGQAPAFFAAGTELLRSKSLDRDSYDSGDWFNGIDWTGQRSSFGTGLPAAARNRQHWPLMSALLENPHLKPDPAAMERTRAGMLDLLRLRSSSPLFTLGDASLIRRKVWFPSAGAGLSPGVIVMAIVDDYAPTDPKYQAILVVFNASPELWSGKILGMAGREFTLHPVQRAGVDTVVKESVWQVATGFAQIPARTVTVFVEPRTPQHH